ncbi:hypothetical protein TNCV_922391 [Trichonephila clavipes]|nr:hypothetical protein TNCV_922391 [Trichonephila clavipes]
MQCSKYNVYPARSFELDTPFLIGVDKDSALHPRQSHNNHLRRSYSALADLQNKKGKKDWTLLTKEIFRVKPDKKDVNVNSCSEDCQTHFLHCRFYE